MKPKDLKSPFTWENRRPLLQDGVLFVPEYYELHKSWQMPAFRDPALFGNANPIYIEYCSGNGAWLIDKALQEPNINWIGVEWRFERVRKIWSKARNHKLSNLLIVCGEAQTFTREYLPEGCIEEVFVNFPDPWPKAKHAKNRLLQAGFIDEIARVMKKGGKSTIVTDDEDYKQQIIEAHLASPYWKSAMPSPYYILNMPEYGTSYFDTLWRSKGCSIKFMKFYTV